ncbi:chemotaxis signal transduction protein [Candidatus Vecturithrix granuli]|uniref:Chemotaxis signal transduction protein n=1 Tax=Vecturithrix granuli TaxID=1499967 RepID=A0A0S6W8Z8_VECG1|nr:chemotaxis signal transduction protein [Candidatus Vecturithrix granuli]
MNENGVQLVCFEICGEKFAFNMDFLIEIIQVHQADITPFFSSIPIIRGYWTYRRKTVYLLDVRDFFGLVDADETTTQMRFSRSSPEQEEEERKRAEQTHGVHNILVVKIREQIFGLYTDAVLQVASLLSFYEYPLLISTLPRRYFAGVTVIGTELVLLLALEELINEYEFEAELSRIGEGDVSSHPFTG